MTSNKVTLMMKYIFSTAKPKLQNYFEFNSLTKYRRNLKFNMQSPYGYKRICSLTCCKVKYDPMTTCSSCTSENDFSMQLLSLKLIHTVIDFFLLQNCTGEIFRT